MRYLSNSVTAIGTSKWELTTNPNRNNDHNIFNGIVAVTTGCIEQSVTAARMAEFETLASPGLLDQLV